MRLKLVLAISLAFTLLILAVAPLILAADPAIIPLGSDQTEVRTAYRALFEHIGGGGRAHWAQQGFNHAGQDYAPGTVVAPTGLADSGFDNRVVSGTVNALPSLALDAVRTRVAVFRTTVSDPSYGDAAWELADVRETLDTYLWGSLRYDVLDEAQLVAADLSQYEIKWFSLSYYSSV